MIEVKAPNKVPRTKIRKVFLAGSIEMGKAVQWQAAFTKAVSDLDIVVLNPRRDDWDSTWEQSINNTKFREQVSWEHDNVYWSDYNIFYFDPATKSPITLMELGMVVTTRNRILVCCPPGFWRKGNVDILCERYDIPVVESLEDLITQFRQMFKEDS